MSIVETDTPVFSGPSTRGDQFDMTRVAWVNPKNLDNLEAALNSATEIVFDLETTGLNEHARTPVAARVVMATFTLPQVGDVPGNMNRAPITWVLPLSHPLGEFSRAWRKTLTRIARVITKTNVPLVAHNGKFDQRWVYAATGVDLSTLQAWDTEITERLLNENQTSRLEASSARYFGISEWGDALDLSTPGAAEKYPLMTLGEYAARDTYWTWRVYRLQQSIMGRDAESWERPYTSEEVTQWRLGDLAEELSMRSLRSMSRVEMNGIYIDKQWVKNEISILEETRHEAQQRLLSNVSFDLPEGQPSLAATSKWYKAYTQAAVDAGELQILEYTRRGAAKWNKHVLTKLAARGYSIASDILEHRRCTKRLEYLNAWLTGMTSEGRIHATYHLSRTVTGRLSASDPNVQQITRELKPAFLPSRDRVIAEIDFSQIELRVAAFVARCEPMLNAYQKGDDLHRLMASRISGKDPADINATERQQAKAANFGLLYGQSPEGFQTYAETAYGVSLTLDEAELTWHAFFDQWDGMAEWHAATIASARKEGEVISPIGRVRRVPDINCGVPYLEGEAERQALNAPVQGFASDLMQIVIVDIQGMFDQSAIEGVRVLGTVHDSVIVEADAHNWRTIIEQVMSRAVHPHRILERLDCVLDVPLAVEATVGTRWGLDDVGVLEFSNLSTW